MGKTKRANIETFMSRVEKTNTCWLWTAGKNGDGYGNWSLNGRNINAHRASYILFVGEIPNGLHVCHNCDNPSCVNPDHLWLGTYKDNAQDRARKGRNNSRKGESHGNSKLTEDDVREIRQLYRNGTKQVEISRRFSISSGHVSSIISNKLWKQQERSGA